MKLAIFPAVICRVASPRKLARASIAAGQLPSSIDHPRVHRLGRKFGGLLAHAPPRHAHHFRSDTNFKSLTKATLHVPPIWSAARLSISATRRCSSSDAPRFSTNTSLSRDRA